MSLKLGVHVSISGCLSNSIYNALNIGCSAFQIFTRSPRQWKAKDISPKDSSLFIDKLKESSISFDSVVVHMPYLPNLSAPDGELYQKSLKSLEDEIIRCNLLQIPSLVIHLGSHLGKGSSYASPPKDASGRAVKSPPRPRSNTTAAGTIGTTWPVGARPGSRRRPRPAGAITPSAAASPKALPPVSSTACTRSTWLRGSSRSVSRVPGPPPRTSTPPTAPAAGRAPRSSR